MRPSPLLILAVLLCGRQLASDAASVRTGSSAESQSPTDCVIDKVKGEQDGNSQTRVQRLQDKAADEADTGRLQLGGQNSLGRGSFKSAQARLRLRERKSRMQMMKSFVSMQDRVQRDIRRILLFRLRVDRFKRRRELMKLRISRLRRRRKIVKQKIASKMRTCRLLSRGLKLLGQRPAVQRRARISLRIRNCRRRVQRLTRRRKALQRRAARIETNRAKLLRRLQVLRSRIQRQLRESKRVATRLSKNLTKWKIGHPTDLIHAAGRIAPGRRADVTAPPARIAKRHLTRSMIKEIFLREDYYKVAMARRFEQSLVRQQRLARIEKNLPLVKEKITRQRKELQALTGKIETGRSRRRHESRLRELRSRIAVTARHIRLLEDEAVKLRKDLVYFRTRIQSYLKDWTSLLMSAGLSDFLSAMGPAGRESAKVKRQARRRELRRAHRKERVAQQKKYIKTVSMTTGVPEQRIRRIVKKKEKEAKERRLRKFAKRTVKRVRRIQQRLSRAARKAVVVRQRQLHIRQLLRQMRRRIRRLKARICKIEERIERLESKRRRLMRRVRRLTARRRQIEKQLLAANPKTSSASVELKKRLRTVEARIKRAANQIAACETRVLSLERRRARVKSRLRQVARRRRRLGRRAAAVQRRLHRQAERLRKLVKRKRRFVKRIVSRKLVSRKLIGRVSVPSEQLISRLAGRRIAKVSVRSGSAGRVHTRSNRAVRGT